MNIRLAGVVLAVVQLCGKEVLYDRRAGNFRRVIVQIDEVSLDAVQRAGAQMFPQDPEPSGITMVSFVKSREQWAENCKCATETGYEYWFESVKELLRKRRPAGELLIVGAQRHVRTYSENGVIERQGGVDLDAAGSCRGEIAGLSIPAGPSDRQADVFVIGSSATRQCSKRLSTALSSIVQVGRFRVAVRSDPYFQDETDFPFVYRFGDYSRLFRSESSRPTARQVACHVRRDTSMVSVSCSSGRDRAR